MPKHVAPLAIALAATALGAPALAQSGAVRSDASVNTQLFVGTCYQPVDRSPEQIKQDIAVMKKAGFTMVRMGDLSWDSFEPEEGHFTFDWFDAVLAQMHSAGIRVVLDIPGLPAPMWLHQHYPGVDIINQEGSRLHPATRYQDDISDPDYRRQVHQLAVEMLKRYAHNPAVIAVGYDNEVGSSPMSYSEEDRVRFVHWLKQRYGSIAALNKAWATQRWSRRINNWDQVYLPYGNGPGPNERNLDLHRFWSDMTVDDLKELDSVRQQYASNLPAVSNLWPDAGNKGFDYARSWEQYSTFGAQGFYPGDPRGAAFYVMEMRAGHHTPVWFNEFTAGGGGYYGTPGRSRMWAYFGLLYYTQTFLAWTFNSHIGGEEQSLFGLLDHDSRQSWKVDEFAQIAREFRKLQKMGFPRSSQPQVAIHFSYETNWITNPPRGPNTMKQYFAGNYSAEANEAFDPLFKDNVDAAIIDIGHDPIGKYKLVILPSAYLMDEATIGAVRNYVAAGGTVIMTGYSDKVDSTGKWFETPLPGELTDVFGLRTNEFYRSDQPLKVEFQGQQLTASDSYYEVLEPSTAKTLATFENTPGRSPAIMINRYGKGAAIYLATAPQSALMTPLVRSLYAKLGIQRGPVTPDGVVARVVEGRTMYVNTNRSPVSVSFAGYRTDALTGKRYSGKMDLPGYGVAILD